jgi:hypothetical protein
MGVTCPRPPPSKRWATALSLWARAGRDGSAAGRPAAVPDSRRLGRANRALRGSKPRVGLKVPWPAPCNSSGWEDFDTVARDSRRQERRKPGETSVRLISKNELDDVQFAMLEARLNRNPWLRPIVISILVAVLMLTLIGPRRGERQPERGGAPSGNGPRDIARQDAQACLGPRRGH